jgi:hypothetical protein
MALRSVRLQTAQITRAGQVTGNFRACTLKLSQARKIGHWPSHWRTTLSSGKD